MINGTDSLIKTFPNNQMSLIEGDWSPHEAQMHLYDKSQEVEPTGLQPPLIRHAGTLGRPNWPHSAKPASYTQRLCPPREVENKTFVLGLTVSSLLISCVCLA